MNAVQRRAQGLVISAAMVLVSSGCLSPGTIAPVAEDNSANLLSLGQNVAQVSAALRAEVAFHGELQVYRARTAVLDALTVLAQQSLPSKAVATDAVLTNAAKPWNTWLTAETNKVSAKLETVDGVDREALVVTLAERHPVLLDAALGDRSFSHLRILWDAVQLVELNLKIGAETDPDVLRALQAARTRIADPYLVVVQTKEQVAAYSSALDEYLDVMKGQVELAMTHASSLLDFADAKPAMSSVQDLMGNEGLREGVLGLVESRKGSEYADRVRSSLDKYDQAAEVLGGTP